MAVKTKDEEFCSEMEFEALGYVASKSKRGSHLEPQFRPPPNFWDAEWEETKAIPEEGDCVVFVSIPWSTPNSAHGTDHAVYVKFNGLVYMNRTGWKQLPSGIRQIFGGSAYFFSKIWVPAQTQ